MDERSPRRRAAQGQRPSSSAVAAAHRAFAAWSRIPARERGKSIARLADRMETERESLARLVALETGNALATQARPELAGMLDILQTVCRVRAKSRAAPFL